MINYGIIGVGAVFEVFQVQSLLRMKEIKLYSASDVNEDRLKQIQQKYGFKKIYTDYHDMLNDKEVDVVMVNTPQHLHVEPCVDAAKAKKHIYVEKPIATTLSDAKKMIEAAKENKVKLCVGHQRRFINVEMKGKEIIEAGYLGEIFKIRVIACWYESIENLLSKPAWYKIEYGGGPLMRWGIHKADTLRYLLNQDAIRVYAEAGLFVHRRDDITVEDNLVSLIKFNKGAIAELEVSNSQHEAGQSRGETIEIWGTEGTLWYQPSTGLMELYSKKETNSVAKDSFIKIKMNRDNDEFIRIHQKFVESIEKDCEPPVTGEDAYKALEIVIGCYKSAKEKIPVSIPIEND